MKIDLITFWKEITDQNSTSSIPAVCDTGLIDRWSDITNEESNTFYTGDNLVILQCEISSNQLSTLQANTDCFLLRIDGISQSRVDLATWLIGRGIDVTKYANANFNTDIELQATIDQHKSTK